MEKFEKTMVWVLKILVGSAIFALGFDLFLEPNGFNPGGVSGLAMVFVKLTGLGTVGTISALMNLPLFAIGGLKIGKRFFVGSLVGMLGSSALLDLFAHIPVPAMEPLLAALYGGVVCGLGLGIVFFAGASTGGTDIVIRLLRKKLQNVPIGTITIVFELGVAALTAIAFQDLSCGLYSAVVIFLSGQVIDAVVYRFDYSKVAMIITGQYDAVAHAISDKLQRGATFLEGQGAYTGNATKVVLTAIKKQQLAELKRLVVEIDPNAFIIVQEAHQILGDGFTRYGQDSL